MGWDLVPRLPEFFEHIGHTVQMHHDECTSSTSLSRTGMEAEEAIAATAGTTSYEDCTYYNKWFHKHNHTNNTSSLEGLAYYHHIGNATLRYAGVPTGWSAKPYLWVPGALLSHAISKYAAFVNDWLQFSPQTYLRDFVPLDDRRKNSSKLIDDDTYAEPPDDDAADMLTTTTTMKETDDANEDDEEEGVWHSLQRILTMRW